MESIGLCKEVEFRLMGKEGKHCLSFMLFSQSNDNYNNSMLQNCESVSEIID